MSIESSAGSTNCLKRGWRRAMDRPEASTSAGESGVFFCILGFSRRRYNPRHERIRAMNMLPIYLADLCCHVWFWALGYIMWGIPMNEITPAMHRFYGGLGWRVYHS